jgi:hypothetical protein
MKLKLTTITALLSLLIISNINGQSLEQEDSFISARLGLSSAYTLGSGFSATLPPIEGAY